MGFNGFTGVSSSAVGAGMGGNISLTASVLSLLNGGAISSNTFAAGNAGSVAVNAGTIVIDNTLNSNQLTGISSDAVLGAGNGGNVTVTAGSLSIISGGSIGSTSSTDTLTSSTGNAGNVTVNAGTITIDNRVSGFYTGILSDTYWGNGLGTGNAGNVNVTATGALSILNGGQISSTTRSAVGRGGSVNVSAQDILVSGWVVDPTVPLGYTPSSIEASAQVTQGPGNTWLSSSGQTGSVNVTAGNSITLSSRGKLAIQNEATAAVPAALLPTTLNVNARTITLTNSLLNLSVFANT